MSKESRNSSGNNGDDDPEAKRWLSQAVLWVSLLSTVLMLVGLGVAISVEAAFGLPHATVFSSPFELVQLSVWGVFRFIPGVFQAFREWRINLPMLMGSGLSAVGIALAWLLVIAIAKSSPIVRTSSGRVGSAARASIRWLLQPDFHRESFWSLMARGPVYGISTGLGALLASFLLLAALLLAGIMIAMIPLISMTAGAAHIEEYVVRPDVCVAVMGKELRLRRLQDDAATQQRSIRKASTCVRLLKDGIPIANGRVVFATSSSIVLFEPESGIARRVPTSDYVIESIGSTYLAASEQRKDRTPDVSAACK